VVKETQIDPSSWLKTMSGGEPAQIDVTGKWHDVKESTFFSWGEGYLRQEQNKVTGAIGDYNIRGVVSGKTVYLVFLYGGTVYYTARLEMFEDILTGNYFKGDDREQLVGYPTSFARTLGPTKR
jgi:hypothetical protein